MTLMKDISFEQLQKFNNAYKSVKVDEKLIKNLKENDLQKVFTNSAIEEENIFSFNLELQNTRIYFQDSSLRCWLFSLINLIKDDIAKNLDVNPTEFCLSSNYLSFYDKLEKSNTVYEYVINMKSCKLNECLKLMNKRDDGASSYFKNPVRESGRIEYARDLICKYGIVPDCAMPDTINALKSGNNIKLFTQKVKKDIFKLIYKKANLSQQQLREEKNALLQENYNYLCKIYGVPPTEFQYEYVNRMGENIKLRLSPLLFFKKFCKINLKDFVVVANLPMYNRPYFKRYKRKYSDNIYGKNAIEYLNLPIQYLEDFAIKQLKAGMPVCIACENKKYRNDKSTILDTRIFDYEKELGIQDLTKEEAVNLSDITLKHWMCIRGVQLENGRPIRWKVEDTAGANARNEGYYVMNNNFFEKCCFCLWINKKYIPENILEICKAQAIETYFDEPI